jgi:hypothetical protein
MFHETCFAFREPGWKLKTAAFVQRLMALILVNAADKAFASTEFTRRQLTWFCFRSKSIECSPVPANVEPALVAVPEIQSIRRQACCRRLGHFGLFNPNVSRLLLPTIEYLLFLNSSVEIVFIGKCGIEYLANLPGPIQSRIRSTGVCSKQEASRAIAECDLMFQPYPEGISTRRTTAMAALSHGKLLVSTMGPFTDQIWLHSCSVKLFTNSEPKFMAEELNKILDTDPESLDVATEAKDFYVRNFSMPRTVERYCAELPLHP